MKDIDCALITGASAGLGEEYARQWAPRCKRMVLVARRVDRLQSLAELLRQQHDLQVHVVESNLIEPAAREALHAQLQEMAWHPDLLINNAGMGDYGSFVDASWGKLQDMMRLNMEALTHLTALFVPTMRQKRRGTIVQISSLASILPIPDFAVYAATKAYVTSFTEALRIELREDGIRVLAVCPGPVHTEFGQVASRAAGGIVRWHARVILRQQRTSRRRNHASGRYRPSACLPWKKNRPSCVGDIPSPHQHSTPHHGDPTT